MKRLVKESEIFNKRHSSSALRFLSKKDLIQCLSVFSTAIFTGFLVPAFTLLMSGMFEVFSSTDSAGIKLNMISKLGICFAIVGALAFIFNAINMHASLIVSASIAKRARQQLLEALLNKELEWFDLRRDSDASKLTSRALRHIDELQLAMGQPLSYFIQYVTTFILSLFLAFYYCWSLTLVVMVSVPLVMLAVMLTSPLLGKHIDMQKTINASAASRLDLALFNFRTVKACNGEAIEQEWIENYLRKAASAYRRLININGIQQGLVRFLILAMFVQGFWFGIYLVTQKGVPPSTVILVFWSCIMAVEAIQSISPQVLAMEKARAALFFLQDIMSKERKTHFQNLDSYIQKTITMVPSFEGKDIVITDLTFSYPSRPELMVLDNMSLQIRGGTNTFLVGASGCGKSTIGTLLLSLYTHYKGTICLDNCSFRNIPSQWIRRNIAIVQQNPIFFSGSIADNIRFGADQPEAVSDSELQKVVQYALLQEFINGLPAGLDTHIESEKSGLSGGQKQRIAIARALIADAPILLIDEGTSALDSISRSLIMETVRQQRKGKTNVFITHDISQLFETDYVYILDKGQVIEHGIVKDLLHNNLFAALKQLSMASLIGDRNSTAPRSLSVNAKPYEKDISGLQYDIVSAAGNVVKFSRIDRYTTTTFTETPSDLDFEAVEGANAQDISLLNFFLSSFWRIKKRKIFVGGLVSSWLNGAATPVFAFTLSQLISSLFSETKILMSSPQVIKWSIIVLGIALLDGVTTYGKIRFLEDVAQSWIDSFRTDAVRLVLHSTCSLMESKFLSFTTLSHTIINTSEDLRNLVGKYFGTIIEIIFIVVISITWAMTIGWKLTLVGISQLIVMLVASKSYLWTANIWEHKLLSCIENHATTLHETVRNIETVKILNLSQHFNDQFGQNNKAIHVVEKKKALLMGIGYGCVESLVYFTKALLFWYGGQLVVNGEYTVSQLLTVFTLIIFSSTTSSQLLDQMPYIVKCRIAAQRLNSLCHLPAHTFEDKGDLRYPMLGEIQFDKVSFSYNPSSVKVLHNTSFLVRAGSIISIVGSSGSGKSTITSLMQRLFEPTSGQIFFDGIPTDKISVPWLRKMIGVVMQTPQLFNDMTIAENIAYGLEPPPAMEKIVKAAKLASIDDYIESLPESYDTIYKANLSGGQAQRVCIARALVRDPRVLLLDECTSALDPHSADQVRQSILNATKRYSSTMRATTIIVTHSEFLMQIADEVLVLREGQILERGPYSVLKDANGEFTKLLRSGVWET